MFKRRTAFLITSVILVLFLGIGCSGESVQALQDLGPLRQKLLSQYHEPDVRLVIQNGNALGVSFVNSSFNNLSGEEKERRAKEIATYVKENYASMSRIDQIWVSFVVYQKLFYVIDYTNALDTFFYDRDELGENPALTGLTNEWRTVFLFTDRGPNTTMNFREQLPIGIAFLGLGIVWIVATLVIVIRTKRLVLLLLGLPALFFLCWGGAWTSIFGFISSASEQNYQKLVDVYNKHEYKVVEGLVHVLSTQPREGHSHGDIVRVGDQQFEISYFTAGPTYHKTIAYGGILREGTYARVFYTGNDILRIDLRKP